MSELIQNPHIPYLQYIKSSRGSSMILFHGFGANAQDLCSLGQFYKNSKTNKYYFPNGIIAANGVPYGRAWFPIDIQALENAMKTNNFRDMSEKKPDGLDRALEKVEAFIDSLGINSEDCVIGGFSQGAMLATHLMLKSNKKFKGLVIYSGTLLCRQEWLELMKTKESFNFIQSHGLNDALLNPEAARELHKLLNENGHKGEFIEFRGGHEIPVEVLNKTDEFITYL